MEKRDLEAGDLLTIASQHAYCAEHLLRKNGEVEVFPEGGVDALLPILSLLHVSFELTFKAFLLHEGHVFKQYKTLSELIELNSNLGFSKEELHLLKNLTRQMAFHKAQDFELWENRQQLHVFCEKIISLYSKIQEMMPIELQADYLQSP